MIYNALSPEAEKAMQEAAARNRYYSEPCAKCGHQNREHGKYKCFAKGCTCKGGHHFQPPPEKLQ